MQERAEENLKSQRDRTTRNLESDFMLKPTQNLTAFTEPLFISVTHEIPLSTSTTTTTTTTFTTTTTTTRKPKQRGEVHNQREFKRKGPVSKQFTNTTSLVAEKKKVANDSRIEMQFFLSSPVPVVIENASITTKPPRLPLGPNVMISKGLLENSSSIAANNGTLNVSNSTLAVESFLASIPKQAININESFFIPTPSVQTIYEYITTERILQQSSTIATTNLAPSECYPIQDDTGKFPFTCKGYKESKLMRYERSACRTIGLARIVIHETPNLKIMNWVQ